MNSSAVKTDICSFIYPHSEIHNQNALMGNTIIYEEINAKYLNSSFVGSESANSREDFLLSHIDLGDVGMNHSSGGFQVRGTSQQGPQGAS